MDNAESTFGMTALDMAILMGDVESTAQLLAAGADPEHLLKLFALTDLYDVTVVHPDKKKTRELLEEDDKVGSFVTVPQHKLRFSVLEMSGGWGVTG